MTVRQQLDEPGCFSRRDGARPGIRTLLVIIFVLAFVSLSNSEEPATPLCQILESKLKASDLWLSCHRLGSKLDRLGQSSVSFTSEVAPVVSNSPHWRVFLARLDGLDRMAVLLRPNGRHVLASALPPLAADKGGPIRGRWRKVGERLAGYGEITDYWMRPPGGLQVVAVRGAHVTAIQGIFTDDELAADGFLPYDSRHPNDVVALTRTADSRSFPDIPHAGPEMTHVTRWRFQNGRFRRIASHTFDNALLALDRLAEAVFEHQPQTLARLVPERRLRNRVIKEMNRVKVDGGIKPRSADGGDETYGTIFEAHRDLGEHTLSAFFHFHRVHGRWRLIRMDSRSSRS